MRNPNQSDNFDTFNKFAKLTSMTGGDHIVDRKVVMNQLVNESQQSMIKGQHSFLNELVKGSMPSKDYKIDQMLSKHNDDELALEYYVQRKL